MASQKSAAEALSGRREHIHRLALLGEKVAWISHESRNSLQRIQCGLDLAREHRATGAPGAAALQLIQEGSNDLRRLLEDLQDHAASTTLQLSLCSLRDIWRLAWSKLQSAGSDGGGHVAEHTDCADLRCVADVRRLEQVFRNLFHNSVIACSEEPQIDIHCVVSLDRVAISVCDNGPGFPPGIGDAVFDPFFTTRADGTGLGMSIAKRIVEAHGGRIRLGTSRGGGAKVSLSLPRSTARSWRFTGSGTQL